MQTLTTERARAMSEIRVPRILAYLGAAAFAAAAAWFWLVAKGVTIASPPPAGPGISPDQAMRAHYRWLAATLPQERYYTAIAIGAFLCLTAVAVWLRVVLSRDSVLGTVGGIAVGAGSLVWITGNVAELGGHRAVGLMATHANPIQVTNSIDFTIDTITAAFALAAFAMVGAGMLTLAAAAAQRSKHRAWAVGTVVTALAMLATAGSYGAGNDDLSNLLLFIVGVAVLPAWLIWTARIRGTGSASQPQGK